MAETHKTEQEMLDSLVIGGDRAISAQDVRDIVYSILRAYQYILYEPGSEPAHTPGLLYFKDGTLNFMRLVDGVIANLPEEVQTPLVSNRTGSQILNGGAIYVSGVQGNTPTIGIASNDDVTANKTIALATHNIDDQDTGYATTFGMVRGLDTRGPGTETWTEGDEIFLGVDGILTNVRPSGTAAVVSIGVVTVVSPSIGEIFVSIRRIPPIYLTAGITEARPLDSTAPAGASYQNLYVWSWTDLYVDALASDKKQTELTVEPYRDTPWNTTFMRHSRDTPLSLAYQMPHEWARTKVYVHFHLIPMANGSGDVLINGYYAFKGSQDELPALASWTAFTKTLSFVAGDQYVQQYLDIVTCDPAGSPGNSDILSIFVQRNGTGADDYDTSKDHETAEANLCLQSLDIHYQRLEFGSEEEYTGSLQSNPSITVGDATNIAGVGAFEARLLVKSDGGQPVSFRVYDVTGASVVQLVDGGDAEVTGVTDTDYTWYVVGPMAISSGNRTYRIQAKYDSASDEPRLAQARIVAR